MLTWWFWAVGAVMIAVSTVEIAKSFTKRLDRESSAALLAWLIFCAAWPVSVPVALIAGAIKRR
jgi:chromate transport protein ChrA